MKVVIAPDKFKGSLAATQVAAAIADGLRAALGPGGVRAALGPGGVRAALGPGGVELVSVPVADGGEGTADAAVAAGFDRVPVTASGPLGPGAEPVRASYARRGEIAVVELACVCGLARLPGGRPAPLTASSFGAGEVLRAALDAGARRIIFGVGGSASTDGGAGLLQALGARVLDARGEPLGPGGGALRDAAVLDLSGLHPALRSAASGPADLSSADLSSADPGSADLSSADPGSADLSFAEITLAADVDNPLTGPDGAAAVYGPQKGATPTQVAELAAGLRRWAAVVAAAVGADYSAVPGAGAAGGAGFAARAVLGARSRPGIELVLELAGFDAALAGADLVITGEGSLDAQSLAGKAPVGVARAAARRGVPVVAVAGRSTLTADQLAAAGIAAVYLLSDLEPDLDRCHAEAGSLLGRVAAMIVRDRLTEAVTR